MDTNVAELHSQVDLISNVCERMDSTVDKMSDMMNRFDKASAVQEQRIGELEKDVTLLHVRISDAKKETLEELKEMRKENTQQHAEAAKDRNVLLDRIAILERWKWVVTGGALALGFVLSYAVKLI